MKKKSFLVFVFVMMFSMLTFAHSGRTDSRGGHKDNKNKSGLGGYHYHCGGYPAHLHPNGVCPYKNGTVSNTVSSSQSSISSVKSNKKYTSKTDIKGYINNNQIQTFNYKNDTFVVVEDLQNYQFDVCWNENERALYINKNPQLTLLGGNYFDGNPQEVLDTDIKTYIYNESIGSYVLGESYNISGKTIVNFNDLSNLGDIGWDGVGRKILFAFK